MPNYLVIHRPPGMRAIRRAPAMRAEITPLNEEMVARSVARVCRWAATAETAGGAAQQFSWGR